MKKHIILASLIGGTLLFTASANVLAQPMMGQNTQHKMMMSRHEKMMQKIPGYAQLSPDKKATLDKMLTDLKKDMRTKISMIHAKRAMLQAKLDQPSIDKKATDGLIKEISDLEAQALQQRVDTIINIKNVTGISIPLFSKRHMMMQHKMMQKKFSQPKE